MRAAGRADCLGGVRAANRGGVQKCFGLMKTVVYNLASKSQLLLKIRVQSGHLFRTPPRGYF